MKRMKMKVNRVKWKVNYLLIIIFISSGLAILMVSFFNNKISPKIYDVLLMRIDKYTNKLVMDVLDEDVFRQEELNDVLEIEKNSYDEVISVDFNMIKASKIIREGMKKIEIKLNNYEGYRESEGNLEGNIINFRENGAVVAVPIGIVSNNAYFSQLGPKIPILLNLMTDYYGTLDTKIRDYGINTILVEMYINITIKNGLIINLRDYNSVKNYSVLFLSKVVNGRIPDYFGGRIEKSSPLVMNEN